MLRKIKNTILAICFGILLYFYCILTFYTLPNIETNKNTEEKEFINPIEITPEIIIVEEEKEEKEENNIKNEVIMPKQKVTSRAKTTTISNTNNWTIATVTAYCACINCCGKTNGITASGTQATAGRTIAMSKNYKFGTKIEIEGYGIFVVEDRGGAIQGTRIDMFFNTHEEALRFGKKQLRFRIIE